MPSTAYMNRFGPGIHWDPREPMPRQIRDLLAGRQRVQVQDGQAPQIFPYIATPPPKDINGFLPPLQASFKARVVHDTAKVTVTHLFANNTSYEIPRASYSFPLPQGCTVTDFVCRVGPDKILKSKVKPKKEASETFIRETQRHRPAALLEKEESEIFTIVLGVIPANCRLKAEISFITLLTYRFENNLGLTTLTLPLYMAPQVNTTLTATESMNPRGLEIDIDVLAPEDIISVSSTTHSVDVQIGIGGRTCQTWEDFVGTGEAENRKGAHISLKNSESRLDRDFVLEIRTRPDMSLEAPHACVEIHPEFDRHRAVMLTIPPAFMLGKEPGVENVRTNDDDGGEIIFVADRSGSMSDKIKPLKSAMNFFLKGISTERQFNIWCFGTRYESIWDKSRPYSQRNLNEALDYVASSFDSNMGGTELLPALKSVVAAKGQLHSQTMDIITLTDGAVWDLNETLEYVEQVRKISEGRIRFFCLGIGAAVSHTLVEGIAKRGGGYAEVIPIADIGGWEPCVVKVLNAAQKRHIEVMDIEIKGQREWETYRDRRRAAESTNYLVHSQKMMRSPARVFELSPFLRNRIFILFEFLEPDFPLIEIHLTVTKSGTKKPTVVRVPIKILKLKDTTLHKLAARAFLGDLEQKQSHIHQSLDSSHREGSQEKLVAQEGERLGCKWSLISDWTSFVAVEEPFTLNQTNRDSFIDEVVDEIITNTRNDDFDLLLQPRGTQNRNIARIKEGGGLQEFSDEGDTDTEDTASESCADATEYTHNRFDRDDDHDGANGSLGIGPGYGPSGGSGDASGPSNSQGGSQTQGLSNHQNPDRQHASQYPYGQSATSLASLSISSLAEANQSTPSETPLNNAATVGLPTPYLYSSSPPYSRQPGLSPPSSKSRQHFKLSSFISGWERKGSKGKPQGHQGGSDEDSARKGNYNSWAGLRYTAPTPPPASGPLPAPINPPSTDKYVSELGGSNSEPTLDEIGTGVGTGYYSMYDAAHSAAPPMSPNSTMRSTSSPSAASRMSSSYSYGFSNPRFGKSDIKSPQSNIPASSSISGTISLLPLTSTEKEEREFITQILSYQGFDGSFVITDSYFSRKIGPYFSVAVEKLRKDITGKLTSGETYLAPKIALTACLIALLETEYMSQQSLWKLMVKKARKFLKAYKRLDVNLIINDAKLAMRNTKAQHESVSITYHRKEERANLFNGPRIAPECPPTTEFGQYELPSASITVGEQTSTSTYVSGPSSASTYVEYHPPPIKGKEDVIVPDAHKRSEGPIHQPKPKSRLAALKDKFRPPQASSWRRNKPSESKQSLQVPSYQGKFTELV
ncbi:hypothetical protein TWF694_005271 [Orbilia ellipsospora]|uniref:Uncharacterized protein n=1 Tax=Orbilia ellipsospora TaxID=2528407 RepID=A0AAV9WU73_9PEZI